ncbi:MAG: MFS transporter [Smithella sp.]|nr:MFS transporter [Smithella sp.]
MNEKKLWTKDFVTIAVINAIVFLTHFLLIVTIASYAVDEFHASTDVAGLVAGVFIIGALIGRLGTGRIIEGIGSKKVLLASTMLFIVTSALYFAAVSLSLLIIIRLLHGIVFGTASTATGTIVAQIIPPSRRGEGIGFYSIGAILAVAVGPFIGIFLIHHTNFRMIFALTSLLAMTSFALSFAVNKPVYEAPAPEFAAADGRFRLSDFLEYKAIPISLIILIIGFSYSGLLTLISLYAREIRLEKAASFYFLVYSVAVLVTRPLSGRLMDIRGANFVVYPCLLLYAAGMLVFSQATAGIMLLAAAVLIAMGYGNFFSCAHALSIRGVPPHRMGLAITTFFIFVDLGFGVGPYLLGALVGVTGYRGLYVIMTFVILASIPLYHVLLGRKENRLPAHGPDR